VFWHLENRKSSQALVAHACLEEILSQKIGLMEWLKVKVLSSSPSTAKKKKRKKKKLHLFLSTFSFCTGAEIYFWYFPRLK
jgi:hypothetical protein